jgi:hypothetical protein
VGSPPAVQIRSGQLEVGGKPRRPARHPVAVAPPAPGEAQLDVHLARDPARLNRASPGCWLSGGTAQRRVSLAALWDMSQPAGSYAARRYERSLRAARPLASLHQGADAGSEALAPALRKLRSHVLERVSRVSCGQVVARGAPRTARATAVDCRAPQAPAHEPRPGLGRIIMAPLGLGLHADQRVVP